MRRPTSRKREVLAIAARLSLNRLGSVPAEEQINCLLQEWEKKEKEELANCLLQEWEKKEKEGLLLQKWEKKEKEDLVNSLLQEWEAEDLEAAI